MIRLIFGLLMALWLDVGSAFAATPTADHAKRYKIFMVLYRGETDVELGYREYLAQHHIPVEFIVRNIDHDTSKLPGIVQEIRNTKPDLVYTWGTGVTLGILGTYDHPDPTKYITDIPVVFALVSDPVGSKLTPTLKSSGRNFTGVIHIVPVEDQINAIEAYRPLVKLGVLYNPEEPQSVLNIQALQSLSSKDGFALDARPVNKPELIQPLVQQMAQGGVNFFYIGPDTFIGDQRDAYTGAANAAGVPVFTGTELEIEHSNAMIGLVSHYKNVGQFAAYKTEQILVDHIKPRDVPIEVLKRFTYLVRMPVARQLDLYPPMTVLKYAEIVGN
ncbi:MAG TPA: ABC transporter substrate-binding protein [Stellaceae bacterium]|jgi:putative ABC transport system substrate-binding protein|nr:ABC transporter substrate-binding protein [Stellaceae bacterium]